MKSVIAVASARLPASVTRAQPKDGRDVDGGAASPNEPPTSRVTATRPSFLPLAGRAMPELDALRGVAVLLVLLFHGLAYPFGDASRTGTTGAAHALMRVSAIGWIGVPLFFVLSGFLITGILLDEERSPRFFRNFYVRRALRILPPFVALLVVLKLLGIASWSFVLLSAAFLSNFAGALAIPMAYPVLWSLAVEEHFYLAWPALIRASSVRGAAVVAAAIVVLEPIVRALAFRAGWGEYLGAHTWYSLDGLAMGSLLAVAVRRAWFTRSRLTKVALVGAGATVLVFGALAPCGLASRETLVGAALQPSVMSAAFLLLLLGAVLIGSGPHRALAGIAPLSFYGNISYGLYLVHPLVMTAFNRLAFRLAGWTEGDFHGRFDRIIVRFAVMVLVSTLVAWISRWTYEQRFLLMKSRLAPRDLETCERVDAARQRAPRSAPSAQFAAGADGQRR
jgi:peptidoglycan/LPS O-acetylase OafA/YrhL